VRLGADDSSGLFESLSNDLPLTNIIHYFNTYVTPPAGPSERLCLTISLAGLKLKSKSAEEREQEMNDMKKGVLFVCIGNSCRSIMAEALATRYWGDVIHACSAGTYPLGHITAHTLESLIERGIPTDRLYSKGFSAIAFHEIQLIVSLSGDLLEHLLPPSFSGEILRWYVQDPYGEGLSVFRRTLDTIDRLVQVKLPEWLHSAHS
jgi:arsenate reductase (thioredoxin)